MTTTPPAVDRSPANAGLGRLIDLGFKREGRWWLVRREFLHASPVLGSPGLWRSVPGHQQTSIVFEIHDSIFSFAQSAPELDEAESQSSIVDAIHSWALATADGRNPGGWQTPPRQEVDSLIPPARLTILAGTEARQGELICSAGRLALRFSIAPVVPLDLPEPRRRWLVQLLTEAQSHLRLVRVGFLHTHDHSSIVAEVDLTGAPRPALEPLLSTSLDALHNTVTSLVETTVLLADASVAFHSLEHAPQPQPETEKE